MTRVLLTGGPGFVGRATARALVGAGHDVRALIRGGRATPDGCTAVRGDLRDVDAFADALDGVETVVHVAALLEGDTDALEAVNHRAAVALAGTAAAHGATAFVHVSSIAAVGVRSVGVVGADTPCRPTTEYGRSKRRAEESLLRLDTPSFRVAILRAPTVYGPNERGNFLALARAIAGGWFVLPGDGANRTSFAHATNVALAIRALAGAPGARGLFHVDDGIAPTLREVVGALGRSLGRELRHIPFPMPLARAVAFALEKAGAVVGFAPPLDRARLRTLTSDFTMDRAPLEAVGWRPGVSLEAGVAETVREWRAAGVI